MKLITFCDILTVLNPSVVDKEPPNKTYIGT